MVTEDLTATPVGRLIQRGDRLGRDIAAGLRELQAIDDELIRRYPDNSYPTVDEIIGEFWNETKTRGGSDGRYG